MIMDVQQVVLKRYQPVFIIVHFFKCRLQFKFTNLLFLCLLEQLLYILVVQKPVLVLVIQIKHFSNVLILLVITNALIAQLRFYRCAFYFFKAQVEVFFFVLLIFLLQIINCKLLQTINLNKLLKLLILINCEKLLHLFLYCLFVINSKIRKYVN